MTSDFERARGCQEFSTGQPLDPRRSSSGAHGSPCTPDSRYARAACLHSAVAGPAIGNGSPTSAVLRGSGYATRRLGKGDLSNGRVSGGTARDHGFGVEHGARREQRNSRDFAPKAHCSLRQVRPSSLPSFSPRRSFPGISFQVALAGGVALRGLPADAGGVSFEHGRLRSLCASKRLRGLRSVRLSS